MSIQTIETQIEALVAEVTEVQAVYDYPVAELGRKLPALVVLYDGFGQDFEATRQTDTTYRWELSLYWAAEGRTLEDVWDLVKTTVPLILNKFRQSPQLNGAVWGSILRSGEPIIEVVNDLPRVIGHSFLLEATQTET